MSPEGLAHALEKYIQSLQLQVDAAQAFYFGRIGEGIEHLLQLPEEVRLGIDQGIWEAARGEPIDPTDPSSGLLIAETVLHSLENRMGMLVAE